MALPLGAGSPSSPIEVRNTNKDDRNGTANVMDSYSFNKNSLVLNNGKQTPLLKALNNEEKEECGLIKRDPLHDYR